MITLQICTCYYVNNTHKCPIFLRKVNGRLNKYSIYLICIILDFSREIILKLIYISTDFADF